MNDSPLDVQENLLNDINKDLLYANTGLKQATHNVIQQGNQLGKIEGRLDNAQANIKQTDRTMKIVETRAKCYRFSLYTVILLEFLTIIILILHKILRIFK